ncbi:MAG: glycosyltransferase family 4 protein [Okeania sp. SIO2F4]|uniref:glycosyltransferase family 4 protein n=1 Tax=Okeania sp. SIO2F4 TaxID=2607790 RepID=UPI00142923F2|nr:glycosyltransferase family 4 protein [Okeania sp. SIO2F4]NES07902.1 glycosyltransferase family 4 protein [Okeania sp. SIO2F4]
MMKNIVIFRPGVIQNETAFEAMSLIYDYLQKNCNYNFTIIKSEDDSYQNDAFKIISIPRKNWEFNSFFTWRKPKLKDKKTAELLAKADGIITLDPTIYQQGLIAIAEGYKLNKPVWFDTSITFTEIRRDIKWKVQRPLIRKAIDQTTGIIATVPKCLERFRDLDLLDEKLAQKFTIMGHPVDTMKFIPQPKLSEKDGILRVLVVGRILPEKGQFYILEAMTTLLQKRSNIQLQFIGSGILKPLLEKEVKKRGIEEKVLFMNPVPHDRLPTILGAANIYVNHAINISRWEEYFGVSNIEAMSCGLPCVVTLSGAIPYAIREKDVAIMVSERNIIQLQEVITNLLDSEQERYKLGEKARKYVENYYSLPIIANQYDRMLQEGLEQKNKLLSENKAI